MSRRGCSEEIQDLLPAYTAGTLSGEDAQLVRDHLVSCVECREEAEVIRHLREVPPTPAPAGLEARIQDRLRVEAPGWAEAVSPGGRRSRDPVVVPLRPWRRRVPAWALSAAAVVILALGTSVIWHDRTPDMTLDPILVASEEPIPEEWLWDDGMVAGAPVFDDLTNEELEALIEEYGG